MTNLEACLYLYEFYSHDYKYYQSFEPNKIMNNKEIKEAMRYADIIQNADYKNESSIRDVI